jgi:hypothetical protein
MLAFKASDTGLTPIGSLGVIPHVLGSIDAFLFVRFPFIAVHKGEVSATVTNKVGG